ncbi:hypothetical protein [Paraburkholderia sp. EG304]|uniref:hypothetical protein n=1 Tax=Paraburkholderia sp. EG304 TaxID=3237015 RepID=UPI00397D052D
MSTISDALKGFDHFHDWYLDTIAIHGEVNPKVPDTFVLGLFDRERRVTITFRGVTRIGIENGGLLNIVNAIETLKPDSDQYERAEVLLRRSAHGPTRAGHLAYVHSSVGAEIAVEFDSMTIESL